MSFGNFGSKPMKTPKAPKAPGKNGHRSYLYRTRTSYHLWRCSLGEQIYRSEGGYCQTQSRCAERSDHHRRPP